MDDINVPKRYQVCQSSSAPSIDRWKIIELAPNVELAHTGSSARLLQVLSVVVV